MLIGGKISCIATISVFTVRQTEKYLLSEIFWGVSPFHPIPRYDKYTYWKCSPVKLSNLKTITK